MHGVDYLIDYLLRENRNIKLKNKIKTDEDKFNLYRSLCNIREAKNISKEFIREEKDYLTEINSKKPITDVYNIDTLDTTHSSNVLNNDDKMALWQGDITTLKIGAIVNAANSQGLGCFIPGHNCIDNQIHTYAGVPLRLECSKYMKTIDYNLPTGEAFITKAYNLPADYVIHTVGPVVQSKLHEAHKTLLASCYKNCLRTAQENKIRTIAFCSISTGVFNFPKESASQIALKTVDEYMDENYDYFDRVVFNVYSNRDVGVYERNISKN